ncbi:MAG: ABC transporter permease [Patescibacteria group bacterium]|nr:ABC transporter permease [Patescibacteria group bacterium]
MRKFFVLVKKEVQELLTPQMLLPLLIIVVAFVFIGKVAGSEAAKTAEPQPVGILDLDHTNTSALVAQTLSKNNLKLTEFSEISPEEALQQAKNQDLKILFVIPAGFERGFSGKPLSLSIYTILKNFSFIGSRSTQSATVALAQINSALSRELIAEKAPQADPAVLQSPLRTEETVVIGSREAKISVSAVMGFISTQSTFIPIVLFLVITFASQLIALSMATEKENKTLETLLSAPVSRQAMVAAKLVGAGLVALLTAVVYLFGMRYYITGLTAGAGSGTTAASDAFNQLGLVFSAADYALLGLVLFFAILVALSISLILGAFAEDAKSVQGVTAPLMFLVLIPYFLTLFLDINSLSLGLKAFVYAIPFSHAFLAAPNILLKDYSAVFWGLGYMAVLVVIFIYIASRIFSSDKIMTLKLNFRRKR